MKKTKQAHCWYFVDESGDPTFFDHYGKLIIGQPGCSPILILGFIETDNPGAMRTALQDLHRDIALDRYLAGIPSLAKTNKAFHAKDDAPEVRQAVYRCISGMKFKTQFVVARKIAAVFDSQFGNSETRFYDELIAELFKNVLHRNSDNSIYFAQRGSRLRQAPLTQAISNGIRRFEAKWKTTVNSTVKVQAQTPVGEPCLQVIDYMNWAVYRAFVKGEMRYFDYVRDKVSFLVDLYDSRIYPKNYYSRINPFDIRKASPL